MILYAYVKQGKYKIIRDFDFYLRRGNLILYLDDKPNKWPIAKKKKKKKKKHPNIHPQLIA
jgi:hypothetical protein